MSWIKCNVVQSPVKSLSKSKNDYKGSTRGSHSPQRVCTWSHGWTSTRSCSKGGSKCPYTISRRHTWPPQRSFHSFLQPLRLPSRSIHPHTPHTPELLHAVPSSWNNHPSLNTSSSVMSLTPRTVLATYFTLHLYLSLSTLFWNFLHLRYLDECLTGGQWLIHLLCPLSLAHISSQQMCVGWKGNVLELKAFAEVPCQGTWQWVTLVRKIWKFARITVVVERKVIARKGRQ